MNKTKVSDKSTSLLYLNINSLSLHFDELNVLLVNCLIKFDIIGICETGLNKDSLQSLAIQNYTHEDCFTSTKKGGTRIYVKDNIDYIPRDDLKLSNDQDGLESLFIEIPNSKSKNHIIGCIYRHPNFDTEIFNSLYTNLLDKL